MIRTTYVVGQCLGKDCPPQWITTDTDAPIASGDLVHVLVRNPETGVVHGMLKYLESTRDGRWWLVCFEGVVAIGGYFVPAALEKVIARQQLPGQYTTPAPTGHAADEKLLAFWDKESLAARVEWTSQGKQWGIPFPGLDAIVSRPPEFRLPDDFYARAAA